MRLRTFLFSLAIAIGILAHPDLVAQQFNPQTQIAWPKIMGTGTPGGSSCGHTCTASDIGLGFVETSPSEHYYVYMGTVLGWYQVDGGGGGGGGYNIQVNGVNLAAAAPGPANLENGQGTTVSNPSSGNVQVNLGTPPGTAFQFLSFSGLYDDNRALSSPIAVASFSCNGTVCTVITSAAHNLVAGDFVDMSATTSPFTTNQQPGTGSFQVIAAGLTSTHFEFAFSASSPTCASTCGNIYNADYWGIYQAAAQPFLNGHGTVYGIESGLGTVAGAPGSYINCSLGTGGAPTYLIIEGGQNDLNAGASAATIEGYFQTIWAYAHTHGCIVVQGSIVAANYGGSPTFDFNNLIKLNRWLPTQAKSFAGASGGQYWDRYVDYASYMNDRGFNDNMTLGSTAAAAYMFGQRTNAAFGTQSSSVEGESPLWSVAGGQNSITFYTGQTDPWVFVDSNSNAWMFWGCCGNSGNYLDIQNAFPGNGPALQSQVTQTGNTCEITWGFGSYQSSNHFNGANLCFDLVSSGTNSNIAEIYFNGESNPVVQWTGAGVMQVHELAGSGTVPVSVDASGNFIRGAGTGASTMTKITSGICSTANTGFSSCNFTATLGVTYADTAYGVVCTAQPPTTTTGGAVPVLFVYAAPLSTSAITVTIQNADASGAGVNTTPEIDCITQHP